MSELVPQGSLAEVLEKRKGKVLPLNVVHKVRLLHRGRDGSCSSRCTAAHEEE